MVKQGRVLLKQGMLFDVTAEGKTINYYFVFNDIIVKTKPRTFDKKTNTQTYKYVKTIPLLYSTLCDVPVSPQGNFYFIHYALLSNTCFLCFFFIYLLYRAVGAFFDNGGTRS